MTHRGRKNVYDFVPVAGEAEGTTATPARNPTEPPPHLSQAMQGWWRQVVVEYDLEAHQLHLLEQACNAWDRCEQARRTVAEHGLTYEGPHGPRPHPAVAIERDARIAFARLVRDLKLEPPAVYNDVGYRVR